MSSIRDLGRLMPKPGRRIPAHTHAITVQFVLIAMVVLGHRATAIVIAVAAICQLTLIHVASTRRERHLTREVELATTDMVTGLPTRRLLYRHIEATPPTTALTVMFADVDALKAVNDSLGHQCGDDYLAATATLLAGLTVAGDCLVRLGGDEFALATTRGPHEVASALARALAPPVEVPGAGRPVRVSVGTVWMGGGNPYTGLWCAEAAMRTAKRRGSVIEHYDPVRDGHPQPPGVRPVLRPRDQRPDEPTPHPGGRR